MLKGKANNTIRFSWFPGSSHPRVGLFKALGLSGPRRHGKGRSSRPGYAKVLPGWDANLARISSRVPSSSTGGLASVPACPPTAAPPASIPVPGLLSPRSARERVARRRVRIRAPAEGAGGARSPRRLMRG